MDHVWMVEFFPSLSIAKKRTAEPHNRLFHIGTSKGHFWAAWFSDLFAAFCKSMQQPSKTTLKILDTFGHIQAHPVRES